MEKTTKMIIICALVFLTVVIATLGITLPIALKNHNSTTTLSGNNSKTTAGPVLSNITTSTAAELTSNRVVSEQRRRVDKESAPIYTINPFK